MSVPVISIVSITKDIQGSIDVIMVEANFIHGKS